VCTGETYIVYLLYCSSSSISGPGEDFSDIIKQITHTIEKYLTLNILIQ